MALDKPVIPPKRSVRPVHSFDAESMAAKVRWFRQFAPDERLAILAMWMRFFHQINPEDWITTKRAGSHPQDLEDVRLLEPLRGED